MKADAGYTHLALRDLNAHEINWNPHLRRPCVRCKNGRPPTAGSYASTMKHYELTLGKFPRPRTSARCLFLFQDPRPSETNFSVADPLVDPARLRAEHRYFCLTPVAWKHLKLEGQPRWPDDDSAHHYLRRYFGRGPRGRSWSYDGVIAYFLYLLRPADAYVTNIAKCYFDGQGSDVYDTCMRVHLARECQVFAPSVVVSFTSKLTKSRFREAATSNPAVFMRLPHPAARVPPVERTQRILQELEQNSHQLERLGHSMPELSATWRRHVKRALAGG